MKRKFKFLKIGLLIIFFFSLVSFIVMQLWNWLMPELFGLPMITFWKAAGLLLLSKILFSGFRKHGQGSPWKNHLQQKWKNMPDYKREEWKQKFADKWCHREQLPKEEYNKKESE